MLHAATAGVTFVLHLVAVGALVYALVSPQWLVWDVLGSGTSDGSVGLFSYCSDNLAEAAGSISASSGSGAEAATIEGCMSLRANTVLSDFLMDWSVYSALTGLVAATFFSLAAVVPTLVGLISRGKASHGNLSAPVRSASCYACGRASPCCACGANSWRPLLGAAVCTAAAAQAYDVMSQSSVFRAWTMGAELGPGFTAAWLAALLHALASLAAFLGGRHDADVKLLLHPFVDPLDPRVLQQPQPQQQDGPVAKSGVTSAAARRFAAMTMWAARLGAGSSAVLALVAWAANGWSMFAYICAFASAAAWWQSRGIVLAGPGATTAVDEPRVFRVYAACLFTAVAGWFAVVAVAAAKSLAAANCFVSPDDGNPCAADDVLAVALAALTLTVVFALLGLTASEPLVRHLSATPWHVDATGADLQAAVGDDAGVVAAGTKVDAVAAEHIEAV